MQGQGKGIRGAIFAHSHGIRIDLRDNRRGVDSYVYRDGIRPAFAVIHLYDKRIRTGVICIRGIVDYRQIPCYGVGHSR